MTRRQRFGVAALVALPAFLLLMAAGGATAQEGVPSRVNDRVRAIQKSYDAVVSLRTSKVVPAGGAGAGAGQQVKGQGTGVFFDPRGYVVTNYHVVEGVHEVRVLTARSNQELTGRVLHFDRAADLAVVRVLAPPAQRFKYLPLWGAGEAILGEDVIAIGNPFGLGFTVTRGSVSATGRTMTLPNGAVAEELIQTDAPINPGNSGGPLLTIHGDLLGINSAIRNQAQNIGFAIPTRRVEQIVTRLLAQPPLQVERFGFSVQDKATSAELSPAAAAVTAGDANPIVLVSAVRAESPAARNGLQPGDEILQMDDQRVGRCFDLNRLLWERRPGEVVPVTVKRGDRTQTVRFTVPKKPETDAELIWHRLGAWLSPVDGARLGGQGERFKGGLLVVATAPGGAAARAGWQAGDVLVALNNWEMLEAGNVVYALEQPGLEAGTPCTLLRHEQVMGGKVAWDKPAALVASRPGR